MYYACGTLCVQHIGHSFITSHLYTSYRLFASSDTAFDRFSLYTSTRIAWQTNNMMLKSVQCSTCSIRQPNARRVLRASPAAPQWQRCGSGGRAALPPQADQAPAVEPAATGDAQQQQQQQEQQQQPQGILQAIVQNRRVIAVAVAILDVAFLWLAIKLGKGWWDSH
jgi:hypothetical protein